MLHLYPRYLLLVFFVSCLSLMSADGQSGNTRQGGAASCPTWSTKFDSIDDPEITQTLRSLAKQGWDSIIEQGDKLGVGLQQQVADGEQQLEISRQAEAQAASIRSSPLPATKVPQVTDCSNADNKEDVPACQVRLRHNEVLALEGMLDLLRCRVPYHPSEPPRPEGTPIATISVRVILGDRKSSGSNQCEMYECDDQKEFAHAVSIGMEQNGKTVEVKQGSYITLRFKPEEGAAGFFVDPEQRSLRAQPGTFHLAKGMIGFLRAVEPGETKIVVLGSLPATKNPENRTLMNVNANKNADDSFNWAGYEKVGGPFQSVKGAWTVTAPAATAGEWAAWIGIDGAVSTTLIQTGTTQGHSNGFLGVGAGDFFFPWWEVLPDPETTISATVLAGDMMNATVAPLAGLTATPNVPAIWLISLTDSTRGWTFSIAPQPYFGMLSSAEWIMEDPTHCDAFSCGLYTPVSFGNITFDIGDTVMPGNNAAGSPGFIPNDRVVMVAQDGTPVASPSVTDCDHDGFTVGFGATPPAAPGPFFTTLILAQGFVGIPYSGSLLVTGLSSPSASKFQTAQTFMPPGLTTNTSTGKITGTPTTAGTYTFDAVVNDVATGATCDNQVSIKIGRSIHRPHCFYWAALGTWICL